MTNIPLRANNIDSELVSKPLLKCACIKIADLLQYHCDGKGKKKRAPPDSTAAFWGISSKTIVKSKKNIPRKQTEFWD